MKLNRGRCYTYRLTETQKVDISVYPGRWLTRISMSAWEDGQHIAIAFDEKYLFNFDGILPKRLAIKIANYSLNKMCLKVFGKKIFGVDKD